MKQSKIKLDIYEWIIVISSILTAIITVDWMYFRGF